MKKFSLLVIPFVILAIGAIAGFMWYQSSLTAPGTNTETKRVVIDRGASGERIANTLAQAGLVKNAFAFRLYLQLNNLSAKIPHGQFNVPQNLTVAEVIEHLNKGPEAFWVTIPEGYRREEMPDKFIEGLGLEGDAARSFRAEFLEASEDMEGYLFPDSYLFAPETTAEKAVETMRATFDQKFTKEEQAKLEKLGLTLEEAVTLASLIEREALSVEERPVIAGIINNRLELGMPLQIDATIQYVLGKSGEWWPQNLTREQIQETPSPYNTYLHTGIPPAPIANPGLTSLLAVANPEETDYLFYIHDPEGNIHYAEDLEGHNANVARYLN